MKVLLFLALILSIFSAGLAEESIGYYKDPAHPGKCVYNNLVLSVGEEARLPDQCGIIFCGEDSFAKIQTCGVTLIPDHCNFTDYVDIDGPYSECCERNFVC